jgi:hypothetical protein
MAMQQAETALDAIRGVERWAHSRGVTLPAGFAVDLGEAYRSARLLTAGVERLLSNTASHEEDAKVLAELEAWIYTDLVDHLDRLREPLSGVIGQLLQGQKNDPQ